MRGRTARPRRRAQMQRRRRQVTQTERGKNGTLFNYSLAQARSLLSPPPLYPSLYLIPLLGTCFYYSGSNVARMGREGEGKGDAHSSAIKDLLLALPSSSSLPFWCSRGRGGREESIFGGEKERGEGEHRFLATSSFNLFSLFEFLFSPHDSVDTSTLTEFVW